MKALFRLSCGALLMLAAVFVPALRAQQQPTNSVAIAKIEVVTEKVSTVNVITGGSGYTSAPTVVFTDPSPGGTAATATATLAFPVASIAVSSSSTVYTLAPTVTLSPDVSGFAATVTAILDTAGKITGVTAPSSALLYTSAPTVTFSAGTPTGPYPSATATLASSGTVRSVTVTDGGSAYFSPPTVTFTGGGGTGAIATAVVDVSTLPGGTFSAPFQNESYGPAGQAIQITALASGTFPADRFTYEFFVDGISIGIPPNPPNGAPAVSLWTPPQPGSYFLTVTAKGIGDKVTSLAIRYFATGTAIASPVDRTLVPKGSSVVVQALATGRPTGSSAFIQRIEFYKDSDATPFFTDYTYPYSAIYTPDAGAASHLVEAVAYDSENNPINPRGSAGNASARKTLYMITPIGTPPTVVLKNPISDSTVASGTSVNVIADADWFNADGTRSDKPPGFITKVEFYLNGTLLGSKVTFPFTTTWTPQVPGVYKLVAIAFDDKSNAISSPEITVKTAGGLPDAAIVSLNPPGPTFIQGVTVTVDVSAKGPDGGIASLSTISLLVDGNVYDTMPKVDPASGKLLPLAEPFKFKWKSNVTLGAHRLSARVTDVNGLTITSPDVPVNVVANQLPTVSITNPAPGTSLSPNTAVTISAAASDPDGSVDNVEFFANGVSLGSPVKSSPYQISWTPTAAGPYTLSAKVTDNAGAVVTSTEVSVTVDIATTNTVGTIGGGGVNTVYRGDYGSPSESGHFTLAVNRNSRGTFIGYSSQPTGRTYFWTDFPVSGDGTFAVRDATSAVVFSGQISATGVAGTFGGKTFIGPITQGSAVFSPLIFSGTLDGNAASLVVAIVGGDGTVTLYVASGNNREVGGDFLTSTGAFTFAAATGGRFAGTVTASTAIVAGSVSGSVTGTFLLKQQPGRLINLSTRALAGAGDQTMVSGFVVRGTGSKPLLVRAVGPTLANFGVPIPLADPALAIVSGSGATVASNNDWGNAPALVTASAQAGAFTLNASSRDAALTTSLTPGMYTAVVGGSSTIAGNVLVEIYDIDTNPASTARITNISTRAQLNSGDTLLAGFVITGDLKKKLLLRAVGPTLAGFGVVGALADPKLDLLVGATSAATNNDWSVGNAAAIAQLSSASAAVGAFPLLAGSKDAVLLLQVNPGAYTVQVTGVGSSSGVVLIEIYDADP